MNVRLALLALGAALLASCASAPTPYAPAASPDDVGYREQALESGRYRITFRANPDLDAAQTEDLAMRRAAELTLQNGGEWFRVVTRETERYGGRDRGGTSVGVGGSSGSYGSGVGVGIGFDLSPDSRRYETVMEILIGQGAKPDEARAYDARAIIARTT